MDVWDCSTEDKQHTFIWWSHCKGSPAFSYHCECNRCAYEHAKVEGVGAGWRNGDLWNMQEETEEVYEGKACLMDGEEV